MGCREGQSTENVDSIAPAHGELRGSEVRALERMGTQRVDSATRGFIPPLDKKEGGPKAAPSPADLERDARRKGERQASWAVGCSRRSKPG
jgi:hypothetical protein